MGTMMVDMKIRATNKKSDIVIRIKSFIQEPLKNTGLGQPHADARV